MAIQKLKFNQSAQLVSISWILGKEIPTCGLHRSTPNEFRIASQLFIHRKLFLKAQNSNAPGQSYLVRAKWNEKNNWMERKMHRIKMKIYANNVFCVFMMINVFSAFRHEKYAKQAHYLLEFELTQPSQGKYHRRRNAKVLHIALVQFLYFFSVGRLPRQHNRAITRQKMLRCTLSLRPFVYNGPYITTT